MSVTVQGNITQPTPVVGEPTSPFAGSDILAGTTAVVTVGPYTNNSQVAQVLSGISVSNEQNCTVASATFADGTDSSTVAPGSTVSIDVNVSVAADAVGEYSFDVANLVATPAA